MRNSKRSKALAHARKPGLARSRGDFYVPGFASHNRTGFVPGAPDEHRRQFLVRAGILEPALLAELRTIEPDNTEALRTWGIRWHLSDPWCLVLAKDTARWYSTNPDAKGWDFEQYGMVAGYFPFDFAPLRFEPFYFDPTWRRRGAFKKEVLDTVAKQVDAYCDRIEADASAAGLKRAPRSKVIEHFDWLVRYQVKGESFAFISHNASYRFNGGRQTVRKAIVELAQYLELTRRSST